MTEKSIGALEMMGFRFNRNLGKLFGYCSHCRRYEYHSWMQMEGWQDTVVCDKCGYASDYKYEYKDYAP